MKKIFPIFLVMNIIVILSIRRSQFSISIKLSNRILKKKKIGFYRDDNKFTKNQNIHIILLNIIGYYNKRYPKIDQHLTRHFKYSGAYLSSPPSFLCSQIITLFLIQWSLPIRKQGWNFSKLWILESVYHYSSSILEFLLL